MTGVGLDLLVVDGEVVLKLGVGGEGVGGGDGGVGGGVGEDVVERVVLQLALELVIVAGCAL